MKDSNKISELKLPRTERLVVLDEGHALRKRLFLFFKKINPTAKFSLREALDTMLSKAENEQTI